MFYHNLNPVLLKLGFLEIRYYGLVYVLGFLAMWWSISKNNNKLNLSKENINDLVFYIMFGVILGSRLFEILFWNPAYYFSNPLKIFAFWEGGMAFHGGLIGSIFGLYYFCWKNKLNFEKLGILADIITLPAVFALALGRVANFINGELWGTITNVSWCVKFQNIDGCRHPVQIYSAIKRFIILFFLIFIYRKKHKPGFIFWSMITLFGIGRLFIDFLRDDPRFLGLSLGQYSSLSMFCIGTLVLFLFYESDLYSIVKKKKIINK